MKIALIVVGYATFLWEAWYAGYMLDLALVEPDHGIALIYLGLSGYMLYLAQDLNASIYKFALEQ